MFGASLVLVLRAQGDPEEVNVHDFIDPEQGRATPYGVYDLQQNEAWVSGGISHDTAEFAVQTIRTWWNEMGAPKYPNASSLVITADGGGSNGYRLRLWKLELQGLVDELGFPVRVCHLSPGTSKWNKIEHRLFSFITQSWRGKPLVTHQVIVSLISATTTKKGLAVRSRLDDRTYPKGRRVSDLRLALVNLEPNAFGRGGRVAEGFETARRMDLPLAAAAPLTGTPPLSPPRVAPCPGCRAMTRSMTAR